LKRDPGTDPRLNGQVLESLIEEMGEPEKSIHIAPQDIQDHEVRRKVLAALRNQNLDRLILEVTWLRTGPDLPTRMETKVWLYEVDGQWVAFHNYRRYHWAGL
jgi:hypothetical protein